MTIKEDHRLYISIGCLMWIASFFGEGYKLQPYSTVGILISPIITIIGILYWFRYYKNTRGHYPMFWTTWKNILGKMQRNPFAGIIFMFKHILETWIFMIVFWMIIVLIGYLTFGQSKAFETAKIYCENNKEIKTKTGKIRYFGIMVSGKMSTGGGTDNANLFFIIVGEKGNFSVNSELIQLNGEWKVDDLKIE